MVFKLFLDANILLDLTLKRNGHEKARYIIELAEDNKLQLFISASIVHILGYYLTKHHGHEKAKQLIAELLIDITVIDIPHGVILTALNSQITDIEDALQYYTALHHKLDYFISQDKKLKKRSLPVLPIHTIQEFLDELI